MENNSNKNVELMRGEPEIAIKKLAIPIMISMLLTASYNIIDGIWIVGIGPDAIAGIGFINPIFMILVGVSMGLEPVQQAASAVLLELETMRAQTPLPFIR